MGALLCTTSVHIRFIITFPKTHRRLASRRPDPEASPKWAMSSYSSSGCTRVSFVTCTRVQQPAPSRRKPSACSFSRKARQHCSCVHPHGSCATNVLSAKKTPFTKLQLAGSGAAGRGGCAGASGSAAEAAAGGGRERETSISRWSRSNRATSRTQSVRSAPCSPADRGSKKPQI